MFYHEVQFQMNKERKVLVQRWKLTIAPEALSARSSQLQ